MNQLLLLLITFLLSFISVSGQTYESYRVVLDTTITSTALGFEKDVRVTVPLEWQKGTRQQLPVIIIFDSQNARSHGFIIRTIDYLTSTEQMPAAILVSLASEQQYRYLETLHPASKPTGLALANEQFLFEELLPWMEQDFEAGPFRVFIGHSRYGYFTTALFQSKLQALNAVVSLSPFFLQPEVNLIDSIAQLQTADVPATKYYRFGIGGDYPEEFHAMQAMLAQFSHNDLNIQGYLFPEADHNVTPGLTAGRALYEIFEFWAAEQTRLLDNEQQDLSILEDIQQRLLAHYGTPLYLSLGGLNGKGWFFYHEKAYEKAIRTWQQLLEYYPGFSETYLFIADAQRQLKQDDSDSIRKFLISLETSTFYSEQEKKELLQELEDGDQ